MTVGCSVDWPEVGRIAGPCIRPGGAGLTARALEICNLPPGSRVADIGCGEGGTLERLESRGGYCTVGLDCSEVLLGQAVSRLAPGGLVRGLAGRLPFKKDCLDALFCECVLSILPEKTVTLHEFARVLKKGGLLVLSDVYIREANDDFIREANGDIDGTAGAGPRPADRGLYPFPEEGFFTKEELLGLLATLGFSFLLWEDHQRALKEFAARMIIAGASLPDPWCGAKRQDGVKAGRARISYFLMVASKSGDFGSTMKGDVNYG